MTGKRPAGIAAILVAGTGAMVIALAVPMTAPDKGSGRTTGAILVSASSCGPSSFCVTGGALAAPVYPGSSGQVLPISFTNPFNVPITVTSLQIALTNGFPAGCSSSAFQVNGTSLSGTVPSVTISPQYNVAAASKTGPTISSFTGAVLALADQGNQDACQKLPLTLSYTAWATYNSTSCITGNQSGGTVGAGQVLCVAATGKITGGLTVQSGGVLLVNGGTITGSLTSTGSSGINLCGARVTGSTSISGSTGEVVIGDGQSCAGNSLTGGLILSSNTGGIQVINNSVSGGATISSNTGSVPYTSSLSGQFVSLNSFTGGLSCSSNSPFSDNGHPNTVTGTRSGQCAGTF